VKKSVPCSLDSRILVEGRYRHGNIDRSGLSQLLLMCQALSEVEETMQLMSKMALESKLVRRGLSGPGVVT
jgi:hypothetical protein